MGFFYSVRGWFEGDEEHVVQAKRIVAENADENPYAASWHFPDDGGGFSRFFFFGHTVRDVSLPEVREQVSRLATQVSSIDGEDVDCLRGTFHVTAEDDSKNLVWKCAGGRFVEEEITPSETDT